MKAIQIETLELWDGAREREGLGRLTSLIHHPISQVLLAKEAHELAVTLMKMTTMTS